MSPIVHQAQNQHPSILQKPSEVGFEGVTGRGLATLHLTWSLDLDWKPGLVMYCEVESCDITIFIKNSQILAMLYSVI